MPEQPNQDLSKPPDHLVPKRSDDDKFVTEDLSKMHRVMYYFLTFWFIFIAVISCWSAYYYWPGQCATAVSVTTIVKKDSTNHMLSRDSLTINLSTDTLGRLKPQKKADTSEDERLILISIIFGVLGGATHGFASLMNFRGQRRLFSSWSLWYFGRPLIGGMMALIFYVAMRAGLFSGNSTIESVNIYGIAAFSAAVGLFTDLASDKLKDVFKAFFNPKEGERGGRLITHDLRPTGKDVGSQNVSS